MRCLRILESQEAPSRDPTLPTMRIVPVTLSSRREIQLEITPALLLSSMARKIRPTDGREGDNLSRLPNLSAYRGARRSLRRLFSRC